MFSVDKTTGLLTYESEFFHGSLGGLYRSIEWERRDVEIKDQAGKTVYSQANVETPSFWSQNAITIVASKYFRGHGAEREDSVFGLVGRVALAITHAGVDHKYFAVGDAHRFQVDLSYVLLHQMAAFNSPVWFNVGTCEKPQSSACFILDVEDDMESILRWYHDEGLIFRGGSGSGINISKLREKNAKLSGGGFASGPLSFAGPADAIGGVIKSGGKTRRAAKLLCMDADHPDIEDFIEMKVEGEKVAQALIAAGFDPAFNAEGGAYALSPWQNANNSVRVTDVFMEAVANDDFHALRSRVTGDPTKVVKARDLFRKIAEAAWACGDPGLQFDMTINEWHTCRHVDRIYASNPCGEYNFLNNTACNLASINLMKVDVEREDVGLMKLVPLLTVAMDIIVEMSGYPTPTIEREAKKYRTLGLGYANLGAYLMSQGLPYDSQAARLRAASITSELTALAYSTSVMLAQVKGPFEGFDYDSMYCVLKKHRSYDSLSAPWESLLGDFKRVGGIRNAQATVIAPTGTIGFMMDCDTTGIEPEIALVKYKKLVGGGSLKLVNGTVDKALTKLGYSDIERALILAYIEETGTIELCPTLHVEHLPVFDCSLEPANGTRSIAPSGHVEMMAAVQPFVSGAISKTVNLPADASIEDVEKIYMDAWAWGLKSIAIYRDGCKQSQPLNVKKPEPRVHQDPPGRLGVTNLKNTTPLFEPRPIALDLAAATKRVVDTLSPRELEVLREGLPEKETALLDALVAVPPASFRRKMPTTRSSVTHKFSLSGTEGYATVGLYADGKPGELFVTMSKQGSTLGGLMDAFATAISLCLQYGVPLPVLIEKFKHTRFEPAGFTGQEDIPQATSIIDYIFKWLELVFTTEKVTWSAPLTAEQVTEVLKGRRTTSFVGPVCSICGSLTVRAGACYRCENCGTTTGCG